MQIIMGLKRPIGYVSSLKKRVQTLLHVVFPQQTLIPTSPSVTMFATHSVAMHVAPLATMPKLFLMWHCLHQQLHKLIEVARFSNSINRTCPFEPTSNPHKLPNGRYGI
jgi:hypothetical protein